MSQEGIGRLLEESGWLQGAIIGPEYIERILSASTCIDVDAQAIERRDVVLVVATQSCNLVNEAVNTTQLCIAELIDAPNQNFEYNKHPRKLDTFFSKGSNESPPGDIDKQYIRIDILEKVFVSKDVLVDIDFERNIQFSELEKKSFVDWLGSHYTKSALPTDFNNILASSSQRKRRKVEKGLSKDFLGFYVKIYPNRELKKGEEYNIQLLGLMMDEADKRSAESAMAQYKNLVEATGINVTGVAVMRKSEVSLAMFDGFSRIYLDELSYREGDNFPPDFSI
tara:strand:+ start:1677 stop:2522 length:846 start_codon:yes stop_codon:yes gene_type:complete